MEKAHDRTRSGATVAVPLALLLAGCGGSGADAALDAAVVPGADVLVRLEARALREAAVFPSLEAADAAPEADRPREPQGEATGLDGWRFLSITGLKPEDVVAVVLSADLDPLDVQPEATAADRDAVPAAAALRLARPLGLDTLEEAITGSAPAMTPPTVTRLEVAGVPALQVETPGPDPSRAFLASIAGATILLTAPSRESLAGVLERASSGDAAPVATALEELMAGRPERAQVRVGFVVPQKFRDGLKARLEEPPPEMAMFTGFAAPFEDLQSLSLGVRADDESLVVILAGDLGGEQPVQQASALLEGLLGPMARSALADALGREPAEVDDRLQVATQGSALELTLRLTAEDLAAYRSREQPAPE